MQVPWNVSKTVVSLLVFLPLFLHPRLQATDGKELAECPDVDSHTTLLVPEASTYVSGTYLHEPAHEVRDKAVYVAHQKDIGSYAHEVVEENEQEITPKIDFCKLNKSKLSFDGTNMQGSLQIKFKPESFYAKNANLLNNANDSDRIIFSRSTVDVNLGLYYGKPFCDYSVLDFFLTLRNKCVWGNPESVARTTRTRIKTLESLDDGHEHFITRQIFWLREVWLQFAINPMLCLSWETPQYFRLGAFPFDLGRGIALGSAYGVNPGVLGFYSDNSIDQYAFGYQLFGDIIPTTLKYDLYCALLRNRSDSFSVTAEKIYGQRFGRSLRQERGSGQIDYIFAGRTRWTPLSENGFVITVEPYFLYNSDPEQFVEFFADAQSHLGTFGLASEWIMNDFEWGFDTALNVGSQKVFGWDRNYINKENRGGVFTLVNSQVVIQDPTTTANPQKAVFDPNSPLGKERQRIIDTATQNANQNGKRIGSLSTGETLYNDINRFRNPYRNTFDGWMAVADAAYWFCNRTVRLAVGGGVASGDEDPNLDIENPNESNVDDTFSGFIGLQEIYSGDRIQSAFLLGPAGRIPRPLSTPTGLRVIDKLPTNISGFTNLAFVGGSGLWSPKKYAKRFSLRPNVLAYWQQRATKKFDITTKKSSPDFARNFLGTECNVFFDVDLITDFKMFLVSSVFIPGGHYRDIRGTPLSKDQQRILDRLDVTGIDNDVNPLLGANTAYTLNIGLEYRF